MVRLPIPLPAPGDNPGLGEVVQRAIGAPSTTRIGTVTSAAPFQVSLDGVVIEDLGVIGNSLPAVGQPVLLIGQPSQIGSDPASWVMIGPITTAARTAVAARSVNANVVASGSTAYVITAQVCGTSFVAPPSGNEMILWRSFMDNDNAAGFTLCAPEIRSGGVVGSGDLVLTVNDNRSIEQAGTGQLAMGSSFTIFGLTPGETYNVYLMQRVTAGNGSWAWREVIAVPL